MGHCDMAQRTKTRLPDFARDYELGSARVLRELECCVLGCDYGGTSWTTRAEASRIAALLELRSGDKLLDVGAGYWRRLRR